ncbi:MAG TPA: CAP domain-containing protein [Candidatus Binataceae bacterium]
MPTPTVVRRRRAIKAGMGLLVVSLIGAVVVRLYLLQSAPPSPEEVAGLTLQEAEILKMVNEERHRSGRKPLKFSARLAVVARGHSYDMAMRHYLSHGSPEGTGPADRVKGVGIVYQALGENIYMDDYREPNGLAARATQGWLKSATHRDTMLSDKFAETGVGVARAADGSFYVTQDFIH